MNNKTIRFVASTALAAVCAISTVAQAKSLSSTMNVHVFPKNGQDASQQSKDEASCYTWATDNTGSDPFDLQKQEAQAQAQAQAQVENAKSAGRGAAVGGAVSGAVAGAVIGEIANDDSKDGAQKGAAVGALVANRRARKARGQAVEQAEKSAESSKQASAEAITNFKKAYSVCLEAKEYMVKI